MTLHGKNFIAGKLITDGDGSLVATNPATNSALPTEFHEATPALVDHAMRAASEAFAKFKPSADQTVALLQGIAEQIESLADILIERCCQETGLPEGRIIGERGRTVGQLRLFADVVSEGSWVDARIDHAMPDRKPIPKPDLRRMLIPIGPVAVFGASNFPLAFSVAGGDTASALAAGNPVVVKSHPAHPGTSELIAGAIVKALESTGFPAGWFSMVQSKNPAISIDLVKHPCTCAVGFTGSQVAGRALFDAAASRPNPIPVYAEMGSVNPVFILPNALAQRSEAIAVGLAQSMTLGVGQFCTNPGMILGIAGEAMDQMIDETANQLRQIAPATMLHEGILNAYQQGAASLQQTDGVTTVIDTSDTANSDRTQAGSVLATLTGDRYLDDPAVIHEVFGPCAAIVNCNSKEQMLNIAHELKGHLTATIHGNDDDLNEYAYLVSILQHKVGRLIFNGYPTGVEVCAAMNHGGPYPATTDVRTTSVGTAAIERFARPICYQDFPDALLPVELCNVNTRKIRRLIDNQQTP